MSIRIELNSVGIQELLKSAEVARALDERAQKIAAAAGDGMVVEPRIGRTRARTSVRTGTPEAMMNEAVYKALTGSLDAGRD